MEIPWVGSQRITKQAFWVMCQTLERFEVGDSGPAMRALWCASENGSWLVWSICCGPGGPLAVLLSALSHSAREWEATCFTHMEMELKILLILREPANAGIQVRTRYAHAKLSLHRKENTIRNGQVASALLICGVWNSICNWLNQQMQNLQIRRGHCIRPFDIRDLSIHGFWCPQGSWHQSPTDTKGDN